MYLAGWIGRSFGCRVLSHKLLADLKMAHNLLLQADDLLKQMGLEARGVEDASVKRDLLGKVR